ncbi:protein piccolo-like isoform X4 [Branchiostoma lanceolatum]|uniref:protein piccolo-like isoform X4 n=1 Tax=Branchiostoma lanceolatum TaxID=7740 RepID=UPI00345522AD
MWLRKARDYLMGSDTEDEATTPPPQPPKREVTTPQSGGKVSPGSMKAFPFPPTPIAEPPEADLSHLTEEERAQIEAVLARAKELQDKEEQRVRELEEDFTTLAETVVQQAATKAPTPETAKKLCPICHTTELPAVSGSERGASGAEGRVCYDCERVVCVACGSMSPSSVKKGEEWLCQMCQKRRHLVLSSGAWYQSHKPTSPSHSGVNFTRSSSIEADPSATQLAAQVDDEKGPKLERNWSLTEDILQGFRDLLGTGDIFPELDEPESLQANQQQSHKELVKADEEAQHYLPPVLFDKPKTPTVQKPPLSEQTQDAKATSNTVPTSSTTSNNSSTTKADKTAGGKIAIILGDETVNTSANKDNSVACKETPIVTSEAKTTLVDEAVETNAAKQLKQSEHIHERPTSLVLQKEVTNSSEYRGGQAKAMEMDQDDQEQGAKKEPAKADRMRSPLGAGVIHGAVGPGQKGLSKEQRQELIHKHTVERVAPGGKHQKTTKTRTQGSNVQELKEYLSGSPKPTKKAAQRQERKEKVVKSLKDPKSLTLDLSQAKKTKDIAATATAPAPAPAPQQEPPPEQPSQPQRVAIGVSPTEATETSKTEEDQTKEKQWYEADEYVKSAKAQEDLRKELQSLRREPAASLALAIVEKKDMASQEKMPDGVEEDIDERDTPSSADSDSDDSKTSLKKSKARSNLSAILSPIDDKDAPPEDDLEEDDDRPKSKAEQQAELRAIRRQRPRTPPGSCLSPIEDFSPPYEHAKPILSVSTTPPYHSRLPQEIPKIIVTQRVSPEQSPPEKLQEEFREEKDTSTSSTIVTAPSVPTTQTEKSKKSENNDAKKVPKSKQIESTEKEKQPKHYVFDRPERDSQRTIMVKSKSGDFPRSTVEMSSTQSRTESQSAKPDTSGASEPSSVGITSPTQMSSAAHAKGYSSDSDASRPHRVRRRLPDLPPGATPSLPKTGPEKQRERQAAIESLQQKRKQERIKMETTDSTKAAERSTDRMTERSTERPVERTVERPVERTAERTVERTAERTVERTAERTVERTADRTTDRSTERKKMMDLEMARKQVEKARLRAKLRAEGKLHLDSILSPPDDRGFYSDSEVSRTRALSAERDAAAATSDQEKSGIKDRTPEQADNYALKSGWTYQPASAKAENKSSLQDSEATREVSAARLEGVAAEDAAVPSRGRRERREMRDDVTHDSRRSSRSSSPELPEDESYKAMMEKRINYETVTDISEIIKEIETDANRLFGLDELDSAEPSSTQSRKGTSFPAQRRVPSLHDLLDDSSFPDEKQEKTSSAKDLADELEQSEEFKTLRKQLSESGSKITSPPVDSPRQAASVDSLRREEKKQKPAVTDAGGLKHTIAPPSTTPSMPKKKHRRQGSDPLSRFSPIRETPGNAELHSSNSHDGFGRVYSLDPLGESARTIAEAGSSMTLPRTREASQSSLAQSRSPSQRSIIGNETMSQIEKAMHRRGSTSGDDDGKKSRIRYEILLEGKYKQVESVDKERLVQASTSLDRGVSKSAWHVGSLESIPGRNSSGHMRRGPRQMYASTSRLYSTVRKPTDLNIRADSLPRRSRSRDYKDDSPVSPVGPPGSAPISIPPRRSRRGDLPVGSAAMAHSFPDHEMFGRGRGYDDRQPFSDDETYTGTFRLHDSVAQLSRDVWNEMDEDDQPFMERLEEGGVTILEQHRKRKTQRPTSMYEFPTRKYYLSRDPKDRSVQGNGLGLRVVGGKEIPGGRGEIGAYVARIYPGGVAEQVEGLFEGAQVLEWNGAKLTGKTYEEVLKIVSVSNGEIEIVIRSDFNMLSDTQHQSAADRKRSGFGPCRQYSKESAVDPDQLAAQLATMREEKQPNSDISSWSQHGHTASPSNIASPSLSTASSTAPSPILPASPAMARQAPRKLPSKEASKETDITGEIELQMRYDETTKDLIININRARNLAAKDINGFSDPFVKVYLLPGRNAENKRRTKYIPKTLNPEWNQTVIYKGITKEQLKSKTVEFTVWDYDRFTPNDFLGEVLIDLSDASFLDNQPHWFTLYEHDENNSAELPKPKTLSPLTPSKAFHTHQGKQVDLQKSRSHQSLITAADEEEYEKARRRYYKAQSLTNIHQDEATYRYRRTRSSLGEELTSDRRLSLQHGYGVSLPFREVSPSHRLMQQHHQQQQQQQAERRRAPVGAHSTQGPPPGARTRSRSRSPANHQGQQPPPPGNQMSSVMSDSPLTYRKRFVNERHQPSSLARNHVSSSDTSIVQMRESPQMNLLGEDESSHSEPATPRSAAERDRKVPSFHGKHDRDDLRKQVARKKLDSLGSSASSNGSLSSLQSGESSSTGYSGGAPPSGWPGRQNLSGMGRHPPQEDMQRHHINNQRREVSPTTEEVDEMFNSTTRLERMPSPRPTEQEGRKSPQYQTWDTIEQQVDSEGNRMMSSPKHTMYSQMAVGELGPGQLMDPGSMGNPEVTAEVRLNLRTEINEQGEMLMVHIVNVQNITYRFKSDDYLPDLYVKCYLVVGNRKVAKKKTRTCKSDREPEFNEMLKFDLEFGKSILQVNLLEDGGKFGRNTLIGETLIWLDNVNLQHGVKAWYKLMLQPMPRVSPDRLRASER